jgi:hypothetical protein
VSQIPSTGGALPPLDFFNAASGLASGGPSSAESGDIFNRARSLGGDTSFGGIKVGSPSGISGVTLAIAAVGVFAVLVIFKNK